MIRRKRKLPQQLSQHYDVIGETHRRYKDGREVCLDNKAGQEEYRQRTMAMVIRQNYICSRGDHRIVVPTFDHSTSGRGMGSARRDDRITDAFGNWINSASCYSCNGAAGSRGL